MGTDEKDSPEEENQTPKQAKPEEKIANVVTGLIVLVILGGFGVTLYSCVADIPSQEAEQREQREAEIRASLNPTTVRIEDDAVIDESFEYETSIIESTVGIIRAYGYRCDSISGFFYFITSRTFAVICNESRYRYELEDRGGNWVVTLD